VRRGAIVRLVLIGVFIAVVCTLVAVLIPWLPDSASKQMDRIEFIYWFATVISIAIFALVGAVLLYSVFAFRSAPEDESDGPSIHGHTGLEIAWTVVPAILVIAIGVMSAIVLSQNGNAGTNPMTIKVFAQQFAWRFEYPDQKKLKSNKLVMPVDRNITFELESADVIHSFWIPAMGQKQDVVPGIDTSIVVTPTKTGNFTLICTELCGLGHALMRAKVIVMRPTDFQQWARSQQQKGGQASAG
jgi:cytochrome c oxidase subunit 2